MNFRNRKRKGAILALATLFLFLFVYGYECGWNKVCGTGVVERVVRGWEKITLPQGVMYAEIADTPQARAQGLSGRKGLEDNEGLLFVFDRSGQYGFWMKDMLFSIDIVWINEEGTVVHIERNVSPDTYFKKNPPETFINTPAAKYVLELASGQAEKYGIYLGTKVKIGE